MHLNNGGAYKITLKDEHIAELTSFEVQQISAFQGANVFIFLKKGVCSAIIWKGGSEVYLTWANQPTFDLLGVTAQNYR
jgi:hypothetical protein